MQVKRVATLLAVGFVIFYLFSRPAGAADVVSGVISGIMGAADKLAIFADKIQF